LKLGGLGLYKKGRSTLGKKYNAKDYWLKRGKNYFKKHGGDIRKKPQEEFTIKFLNKIHFESVFEVACGFGRYTLLINKNFKPTEYYALDISPHQILNAQKICNDYKINWIESQFEEYKLNKKFDLVFGSEILLHVRPENIEEFIEHLISFSNKHLIFIDLGTEELRKMKLEKTDKLAYSFPHDFKRIFNLNEKVESIEEFRIDKMYSIYHIQLYNDFNHK